MNKVIFTKRYFMKKQTMFYLHGTIYPHNWRGTNDTTLLKTSMSSVHCMGQK